MRLFQNSGVYPAYRQRLYALTKNCTTFNDWTASFLEDRYGASHILKPILDFDPDAFFTNGDTIDCQRLWAKEKGMRPNTSLEDILIAQIEDHRTEVFYNTDPMRYGDRFLRRLPGHVRRTVAWRAAPSSGGQFLNHDIIVNNFPSILETYRREGVIAEYFTPAHDPIMNTYAKNDNREIDVLFIGAYSRHHRNRGIMLEAVAALRKELKVVLHLDISRWTHLANSPLGLIGPLRKYRSPRAIRTISQSTVFGRELLETLAKARIVINGAIDMAGHDRGNMRVWETLGCRAALVTDEGNYPAGMIAGEHFITYQGVDDVIVKIKNLHCNEDFRYDIAQKGHEMIKCNYSKNEQWLRFCEIAS